MDLAQSGRSVVIFYVAIAFFADLALGVVVPPTATAWKAGAVARQEMKSHTVIVGAKGVELGATRASLHRLDPFGVAQELGASESGLGIKDDNLWGAFAKAARNARRRPSLDLPSLVRKTTCTEGFQRSTLLHLYDHPFLQPKELHRVRPYTSRKEPAVAVGFTDMGPGCVDHYGHLVENVALNLFKHFVDRANETWAMLGESGVPRNPTIYISDMVEMVETLQGMLPTLRLVRVPWVPQFCHGTQTPRDGCASMPQSLAEGLPLLHMSSNGFPAENVHMTAPTHMNGLGWGFLSQNPLVHRSLQGLVQRFRKFIRQDACGLPQSMLETQSKVKKVLLIERRPDLAETPEHQRTLNDFNALVDAAKSLNAPEKGSSLIDGNEKVLDVETTFLEGATFAQQCNAFGDTHVLIAQHGAALVNCLFLPDGAKVLELATPDRKMVKFFCSDLLPFQHYRLDNKKAKREARFTGALVNLLGRLTPTGTATPSNVGVSFLNILQQLAPHRNSNTMNRACEAEQKRTSAGAGSLKGGAHEAKHLIVVAGQGGSSTRAMSLVLAQLPQVTIGPLKGDRQTGGNPLTAWNGGGLDSMALQLANYVGVPYVHAAQEGTSGSNGGQPTEAKMAQFLQTGTCETIRAILAWREQCGPTSTHALLKDPFFLQFMPYILDAPSQCKEVVGSLGATKFIHVIRDPRIHHHTHRAMNLYHATFNASQHAQHMARLKDKFNITPGHHIPRAFAEDNANTAEGVAKFALVWQWQALKAHRDWMAKSPNDYFLARVEDISRPAEASKITDAYIKMLQILEVPNPGNDALARMGDAYDAYNSAVSKEAPLKVKIIEEFAQEGLREFGYLPNAESDSAGVVRSEGAAGDPTMITSQAGVVRSDQNSFQSDRK
jgi:hypothetical protein